MTWVKLNYDRFLLALFALALLVCAGLLINNARNYNNVFLSLKDTVAKKPGLGVATNQEDVVNEQKKLADPDQWKARIIGDGDNARQLPLFVSAPYIAKTNPDGSVVLVDPLTDDPSNVIHPPVPNKWLLGHKQDLLAANVLEQDSDGDGFSTLDEWNGLTSKPGEKPTDPDNKDDHPPYYTKLFLKRFVRIPFRLRFDARNGTVFQVNTVDVEDAPTLFLHMNDMVKGTKFKITKFEEKYDSSQGFKKDVSELTLTNVETKQNVVLPKQVEVDSPTTYAVLTYLWTGKDFAVQKDVEFTLKPEDNVKYKVLELSDTDVKVVKLPENKELHIRARQ